MPSPTVALIAAYRCAHVNRTVSFEQVLQELVVCHASPRLDFEHRTGLVIVRIGLKRLRHPPVQPE